MRIIGIDPGLRHTGWGIIEVEGSRLGFVACGVVSPKATLPFAERLREIYDALETILASHEVGEAAVEETFVNKDPRSTLKLGQARAMGVLASAKAGLSVGEYAPNLIKKTVVGAGHADKKQIRMMVRVLLPKAVFDRDDAADALAIAITHAQHRRLNA